MLNRTTNENISIVKPPIWRARYWSILSGQAASLIGSALTQFVLLWWIADTEGSVSALSTAGLVALLPQALLGPLGGICADRYDRRLVMIATDLISAACMIVLIVLFASGGIALWRIYTMMLVRSAMQAFQEPAAEASTVMLVPTHFIPRAAGLNETLHGVMLIGSAPLGALALAVMPIGYALAIDVVTALIGIAPLLIFRIPQPSKPEEQVMGLWKEFRQGVKVVWDHRGLRVLYGLEAGVTLVIMPSFVLLPLLVKEHFGGGAPQVALLEGLAGAGMIAGGLVIAAISPHRKVLWVLWSFAASCFALALTGLVPGKLLWLATAWWTASSFLYILGNAPMTALLQTVIPHHLQGRVLSLLSTVGALAAPIGLMLAGPTGELIGIRWLFVVMGTLGGLVTLLGFASRALLDMEAEDAPG